MTGSWHCQQMLVRHSESFFCYATKRHHGDRGRHLHIGVVKRQHGNRLKQRERLILKMLLRRYTLRKNGWQV